MSGVILTAEGILPVWGDARAGPQAAPTGGPAPRAAGSSSAVRRIATAYTDPLAFDAGLPSGTLGRYCTAQNRRRGFPRVMTENKLQGLDQHNVSAANRPPRVCGEIFKNKCDANIHHTLFMAVE